jgi:hypothetical protein
MKPHRLRFLRFSLRTLIVAALLTGSSAPLRAHESLWKLVRHFEVPIPPNHKAMLEAGAALSNDGSKLCWRASDRMWRMFDVKSGTLLWTWECPDETFLRIGNVDPGVSFSADDQFVFIRQFPYKRRILRVIDGSLVPEDADVVKYVAPRNPLASSYEATSADQKRIITRNTTIIPRVAGGWSLQPANDSREIAFIPGLSESRGCCFSPDGLRVATVGYSGLVTINDGMTGKPLVKLDASKMSRVVEFSKDGDLLLVVGRNWTVDIFQRRRWVEWWEIFETSMKQ